MSDVEFVKIISIWCLSVQFVRRSMKSIREDWNMSVSLDTGVLLMQECFDKKQMRYSGNNTVLNQPNHFPANKEGY